MRDVTLGRLSVSQVCEGDAVIPLSVALPAIHRAGSGSAQGLVLGSPPRRYAERRANAHQRAQLRLRVDGRNILIDTCCGNDKKRSLPPVHMQQWPYLENLARIGLRPEDIDLVMCTHLHFDHVGWNTQLKDGRWVPTFLNARYLFGRRDLEFFSQQHHEALHREAFDDSIAPILDAGLADLVDTDSLIHREIGDGIWLQDVSGHSPGNLCVVARCGGSHAIFSGDCFHHPVQIVRPDATFFADEDPAKASATRHSLLNQYADADAIFFPRAFHRRNSRAGRAREPDLPEISVSGALACNPIQLREVLR